MYYFNLKIPNKIKLQQIAINHYSDIDSKDFMKPYRNLLQNHIFSVDNTTVPVNNPLRFRKKSFRKHIKSNHSK